MKLKRLQHDADTICHMFCGWRQIFSKNRLVELGSGELKIDLMSGRTEHDGIPVSDLKITPELMAWLRSDLADYDIPLDELTRVDLHVDLDFSEVPWREGVGGQFFAEGRRVRTEVMHRCTMRCRSLIRTSSGREYVSEYRETEHWPVGWPEE